MSNLLNILDIECTCNHGHSNNSSEVIELGISVLDYKSLEIIENTSIIAKPTTQTISSYCTSLTTITQEMVNKGVTFTEACKILRKQYASTDRVWGSWGNFDKNTIYDQCERENIPYPFGYVTHINIKTLFKLTYPSLKKEVDMTTALKMMNIEMKGTLHRGCDDSFNIALIFIELLKRLRATV